MAFLNPGFLGALSLIALPIVIFLMFRKKFKKVEWAAMEYLLRANRRTNRRLKIENLLLLLIRCLIVAFLVMMMARPRIEASSVNERVHLEAGRQAGRVRDDMVSGARQAALGRRRQRQELAGVLQHGRRGILSRQPSHGIPCH